MAASIRPMSIVKDLCKQQKIRTLIDHPKDVLKKYFAAIEDLLGPKIPAVDRIAFGLSEERLHEFMRSECSLNSILRTAFNYSGYWIYRSICPQQIPSEIEQLAREVERLAPSTILEIGTSNGGTLYIWARYVKNCKRIVSIDLPEGYPCRKIRFFKLFDKTKEFCFLRGDSHSTATVKMLAQVLGDRYVDFLYIDGDHSYEGVKKDFDAYSKFMAPGGIMAFHDIIHRPGYGVDRFWKEVKNQYSSKEIVSSRSQNGFGISILYN